MRKVSYRKLYQAAEREAQLIRLTEALEEAYFEEMPVTLSTCAYALTCDSLWYARIFGAYLPATNEPRGDATTMLKFLCRSLLLFMSFALLAFCFFAL